MRLNLSSLSFVIDGISTLVAWIARWQAVEVIALSSGGDEVDVMDGVVACLMSVGMSPSRVLDVLALSLSRVVDVCADACGVPGAMAVYGGSSPPCK